MLVMRAGCVIPLLAFSSLYAGRWLGRSEETFDSPRRYGLSRPRIKQGSLPRQFRLDLDQDGDLDKLRVFVKKKKGYLEAFLCNNQQIFNSKWKAEISLRNKKSIFRAFTAIRNPDRYPDLILETSASPYLFYFPGKENNLFSTAGEALLSRFPDPLLPPQPQAPPYLEVAGVLDWDGDALDDILATVCDVQVNHEDGGHLLRHKLLVLTGNEGGNQGWNRKAEPVINLSTPGLSGNILRIEDFDGNGKVELLLHSEKIKAESIRAGKVLFVRKYGNTLRQEAEWFTPAGNLVLSHKSDINGDGIPDVFLSDCENNHFLLLLTSRGPAAGFNFTLKRLRLPGSAYRGTPQGAFCFADDVNLDQTPDFLILSEEHNQVQLFLRRKGKPPRAATFFLEGLPRGRPVENAQWYKKSLWYGDLDQDGAKELLVLTNQVLDPGFVPPKAAEGGKLSPQACIRPILSPKDVKKHFAPYFRLLVYTVGEDGTEMRAKINTRLQARGYKPAGILLYDTDLNGVRELVLQVEGLKQEKACYAVLRIEGKLQVSGSSSGREGL